MNRRGFFRGLLGAAMLSVTSKLMPSAMVRLEAVAPELRLVDVLRRLHPSHSVHHVAELFSQHCDVMDDLVWTEANAGSRSDL